MLIAIWAFMLFWALITFYAFFLVTGHNDKIDRLKYEVYELKRWVLRDEKDLEHYGEILSELMEAKKDETKKEDQTHSG